ncbi:hypothetical protein PIB30_105997, partial [Stylosanthes scabra]|nr:hypothetical protein [Stylosanthes scabra]
VICEFTTLRFVWLPYDAVPLVDGLDSHLHLIRYIRPIVSFECVEWHNVDQVMRQFKYWQPRLLQPVQIGEDHCREDKTMIVYHYLDDYMDWFREFAKDWLRLSGRLQEDAYMSEIPEEEPA